ncbi:hypothetical protein DUHN55_38290 [Helicobacter pylori]
MSSWSTTSESAKRPEKVIRWSVAMDPAMAMGTRSPYDEGPPRRCGGKALCVVRAGQLKLSPQAQEEPALGLSIVKPCFSIVSAKSIVAPPR